MASRFLRLMRSIKHSTVYSKFSNNLQTGFLPLSTIESKPKYNTVKEFKTENEITYLDHPDTFGLLSRKSIKKHVEDEGDIKEEKYLQEKPLQSQKLTTKQYADIIKQYIKHKRIKEAIDVLEVRMLREDRVKPENYIYNILIGACADVGYTKKAFKLYNDMKKRALKPTGDTYTCLFTACLNSPWVSDGLRNAKHLRDLMIEKGIEPNVTNYNVMIKTFGRCGDLTMAFKLVDEMVSKKIKVRVHTFNHLLQACITDKDNGLRHALVVWRKMLKLREKPNIYTFNLMLKCIKDCNLGSKEDISDLIGSLEQDMVMNIGKRTKTLPAPAELGPGQNYDTSLSTDIDIKSIPNYEDNMNGNEVKDFTISSNDKDVLNNQISVVNNNHTVTIEFIDYKKNLPVVQPAQIVPNLLSRNLQLDNVIALQDVNTIQDKFAIVGGQDEFLKEMEAYSVQPNIKIFSQMLPLIDDSTEAEIKLIGAMQLAKVKPDIDFYNLLIKKRCLRMDYEKAHEVKDMIEKERKKRHPMNKKQKLKENIMTYGVLALTCKTKDSAIKLLDEMKEKQIKCNIQILGTLLRNGTVNFNFNYIKYIMNAVKEDKVMVNDIFIQHLENFNDKCVTNMKQDEENGTLNKEFSSAYNSFVRHYKTWLTEVNAEEALKTEHPWQQFRETYPTTVQRPNFVIKEPRKFYKRNRKFVMYAPQVK